MGFKIGKGGLEVTGKPSFKEFQTTLETNLQIRGATQWAIGDLVNYADNKPGWGQKYTQLINNSCYEHGTLRNMASQSAHFAPFRRRVELSYSHHALVMKLNDPKLEDQWLDLAVKNRWNRDDLKDELKRSLEGDNPPPKPIKILDFAGSLDQIINELQLLKLQHSANGFEYIAKVTKTALETEPIPDDFESVEDDFEPAESDHWDDILAVALTGDPFATVEDSENQQLT